MDLSAFIAKIFGVYMMIFGGAYFFRKDDLRVIITEFYSNSAALIIAVVINLLLGLAIIFSHNIWVMNWRVLVTIIGYLSLLKGIMNLYVPNYGQAMAKKIVEGNAMIYIGGINFLIGAYLAYCGFTA